MAEPFRLTDKQELARRVLYSDSVHCCLGGGSRSGKTLLFVRQCIVRALKSPGSRHAIFRYRFNAVKTHIVLDTLPKVMDLCWPGMRERVPVDRTDWYLKFPNGSEIWFGGLDDKERVEKILGAEYATIYLNECSQIPWHSRNTAVSRLAQKTENLALKGFYDLNPDKKGRWVYQLFIAGRSPDTKLPVPNPNNYSYFQINPIDNARNLAPEYLNELEHLPDKDRRRFLLGQFSDDTENALWYENLIDSTRVLGRLDNPLPDFLRVVVAVDPSGVSGPEDKRSDEIGILVVALGSDNHGYVLEDLSGRYSPEDWGRMAVEAYRRHSADRVIGEDNFGGDMVRAIIHAQDPNIPYKAVKASRGKIVRAEPVAALYEQGKVHHVGHFVELEDQLCNLTPAGYTGAKSPDRADAAIWGLTELFPSITAKPERAFVPPAVKTREHRASNYVRRTQRR